MHSVCLLDLRHFCRSFLDVCCLRSGTWSLPFPKVLFSPPHYYGLEATNPLPKGCSPTANKAEECKKIQTEVSVSADKHTAAHV